jgi:hypothetical protein
MSEASLLMKMLLRSRDAWDSRSRSCSEGGLDAGRTLASGRWSSILQSWAEARLIVPAQVVISDIKIIK